MRGTTRLALAAIPILFVLSILPPPVSPASGDDELVALARGGKRVLIADFGLGLCKQCKAQSAILERIKTSYKEKVIVRMVFVNKEHDLTARYEIEMIPCLVFFDPSGRAVFRKTGVMKYEEIAAQLSRMGVSR